MADSDLIEQAKRVQGLLLKDFEFILTPDETTGRTRCSPTDRATIARYLKDNNYRVDPASLPKVLAGLIADVRASRGNLPRQFPEADKLPGEE